MLNKGNATLIRWARGLATTVAAVTALLVIAATPAPAQSRFSLEIRNNSQYDIYDVRISSSQDPDWPDDLLGPYRVLGAGTTFTITDITPGYWDVRLEDADHDVCIAKNVPFFSNKTWDLTTAGLLQCEGY
jgi:hypothetical protein